MTTRALSKKSQAGSSFYWVVAVAALVVLLLIAFTTIGRDQIASTLQGVANTSLPWLSFMETASYPLTTWMWRIFALAGVGLVVMRIRYGSVQGVFKQLAEWGLVESGKSLDVRQGLMLGGMLGGVAAFTWIFLSPIPIIPGAVHWRTFAFIPGLMGLRCGRGTSALTGWVGSVVWALVAGYWIINHTPLVDGVMVGVMTGWFITVVLKGKRTPDELLDYISNNRKMWFVKSFLANLVGGLVMSFVVAASLNVTTHGVVPWFAGFVSIGLVSDTLPMCIFTPLLAEAFLRATRRFTFIPNF